MPVPESDNGMAAVQQGLFARISAALAAFASAWTAFGRAGTAVAATSAAAAEPFPDLLSASADTLVVVARRDGRIDRANAAFHRIYGSRTSIAHLLDEGGGGGGAMEDEAPFPSRSPSPSPSPRSRLDRVPGEDGQRLEISWIFTPLPAERWGDAALLGLGHDCTSERAAEIALVHATRLLSLGEIASGLAHEINQPLNVIGLALANIRRRLGSGDLDTVKLAESLARAENNVARARNMVGHLRALGRSGTTARSTLDLREAVDACLTLLAHSLRQLDIAVTVDLAPATLLVEVDRTLVGQILLNLLTNARDAVDANGAPDGARWIHIRGTSLNERVEISIADAGGGIPDALAERVFEPFFTTRPAGTRAGLGLTLSRTMARDLHGTLSFHNEGPGAVFILSLPAAPREAEPGMGDAGHDAAGGARA